MMHGSMNVKTGRERELKFKILPNFFPLLPPIVFSIQCGEALLKQAFLDACGASEKN